MSGLVARGPRVDASLLLLLGIGSFVVRRLGLAAAFVVWLVALDKVTRRVTAVGLPRGSRPTSAEARIGRTMAGLDRRTESQETGIGGEVGLRG
jgi:hypothetical protein